MRYLSCDHSPECAFTEVLDVPLPSCEHVHQPAGLRRQSRSTTRATTTCCREHAEPEHAFHLAQPIQARAVAPTDFLPSGSNGTGRLYRSQEVERRWAHQKHAGPVQPYLLTGAQVNAKRR